MPVRPAAWRRAAMLLLLLLFWALGAGCGAERALAPCGGRWRRYTLSTGLQMYNKFLVGKNKGILGHGAFPGAPGGGA